jgi:hypothetical protein
MTWDSIPFMRFFHLLRKVKVIMPYIHVDANCKNRRSGFEFCKGRAKLLLKLTYVIVCLNSLNAGSVRKNDSEVVTFCGWLNGKR